MDDPLLERIDASGALLAIDQTDRARLLREGEAAHRQLRAILPEDYAGYLEKVFADGARLTQLVDGGAVRAIAVWRAYHTTYAMRRLEIDDLVTAGADRSRGYGATLVAFVEGRARALGCTTLCLNSATFRADAHRFYFRERFHIGAFHFMKTLSA